MTSPLRPPQLRARLSTLLRFINMTSSSPPPPDFGEQEQEACDLLSCLFLDTDLSDVELDGIARQLRAFRIPIPTLYAIIKDDLFPLLYPNLLSIAGEWDAFPRSWLLTSIQQARHSRQQQKGTLWGWVRGWIFRIHMSVSWAVIGWVVRCNWAPLLERLEQNQ